MTDEDDIDSKIREMIDQLVNELGADMDVGAFGTVAEAPDDASDWDFDKLEEEHEDWIQDSLGMDIPPTIIVCRGDEIFTAEVPYHKPIMEFLISRAADPQKNTDWAVFLSTAYMKQYDEGEGEEEIEDYEDGDLAKDDESDEIHMMHMFREGRQITAIYNKETGEEIERIDTAEEDAQSEGRMSFSDHHERQKE